MQGKILKISGPLVVAKNMNSAKLYDVVQVGKKKLIGEIIELREDLASIQVYEETAGLEVGEPVENLNIALSVELAPGLIGKVFDGIGRELNSMREENGERINAGDNSAHLNHKTLWNFVATVNIGDEVSCGDELGYVQESSIIKHKILVPYGVSGIVENIFEGEKTIEETIALIKTKNNVESVCMLSKWPVRIPRPYKYKKNVISPLVTGQRVIDTFFPIAKGGVAAVPGPFGSGKTVVQHQLAKWSNADVVVYIGCGERGNEMTDVLNEFPMLKDPQTGKMLMDKTILVANTSDMPVAAREASIYTGITIAEYYRDMGYNVVIMADSTSRWAEALREMSGRLEEMPGEEGYPAYLASRIAEFYERAGFVDLLGSDNKTGSITAIGAVSPQGGDLSEPVSQATLRIVKVFWGLSSSLAYKRHYPAIDWLTSYSGYSTKLAHWYKENIGEEYLQDKVQAMKLLQEESELNEIIQLVGFDVLSNKDKITIEIARMIREDFLHQNAFDDIDTYTSILKQSKMLRTILTFCRCAYEAINNGVKYESIMELECKKEIAKIKMTSEKDLKNIDELCETIKENFSEFKIEE